MSNKEWESRFGQTAPCTKDGGIKTRPMEEEGSFTPMAMFMMVIGRMTRHTDVVCTAISTEQSMMENGKKTSSMDRVSRPGQMVQSTRANTNKA